MSKKSAPTNDLDVADAPIAPTSAEVSQRTATYRGGHPAVRRHGICLPRDVAVSVSGTAAQKLAAEDCEIT